MGELFLSTRTEIVRGLNIDTGRTMMIIGAPKWFLEWMDRFLPESTVIEEGKGDHHPNCTFDIILLWGSDQDNLPGEMARAKALLGSGGDLWAVIDSNAPLDVALHLQGLDLVKTATLPLTVNLNIVPVVRNNGG